MNADQLASYRRVLERQLSDLETSSREHEDLLDDSHTAEDFTGPDRAADLETFEVDASVAESERRLAFKIHHALDRIDLGTYGLCDGCGEAIPTTRLDAKPSVSLCLRCQESHEAGA